MASMLIIDGQQLAADGSPFGGGLSRSWKIRRLVTAGGLRAVGIGVLKCPNPDARATQATKPGPRPARERLGTPTQALDSWALLLGPTCSRATCSLLAGVLCKLAKNGKRSNTSLHPPTSRQPSTIDGRIASSLRSRVGIRDSIDIRFN